MRTRSKLLLSAVAATALLAFAVSSASATHLRLLNFGRGTRIVWSPLTFEAIGNNIECGVTLEGTFSRETYEKRAQQIGSITRAGISGTCTGGSARVLTETLPWAVNYVSFTGTLPAIETITLNLIGASFAIAPASQNFACLARTSAGSPAQGIANLAASGALRQINTLRANERVSIPLTGGPFGACSLASGVFKGTGTATVLGETAKTIVGLI